MSEKKDLNGKQLFLMGGALFSMHFGASSMVWPMTWGIQSGSSVIIAFIGAFLTSLLLPLMAYIALSRGEGSYNDITKKAMPKMGPIFTNITVLVLAVYVIPRMSAASWDAILQATGFQPTSKIYIVIFSIVYYLICYWFLSSKGKTMDRISTILFPVLCAIVVVIIGKGIFTQFGPWQPKTYETPAFAYGFTEGYATAELICALVFGLTILNNIKEKGVSKSRINLTIIKIGVVGIGMLSLTHLGHMIVGANTGGTIDLMYVSLYTEVVFRLLGQMGGTIFSVGLIFASMTTAIGIGAAAADFFEDASKGKIPYNKGIIVTMIFSAIVGSIGLQGIISYIAPILDIVYPGCIVLTLYYTFMPNCLDEKRLNMCKWGIVVATIFGLCDGIISYNKLFSLNLDWFEAIYLSFPLGAEKLAWVPWTIVAMVLGGVLYKNNKDKKVQETTV